jgi:DNA-binding MarR family transcriptional regulator
MNPAPATRDVDVARAWPGRTDDGATDEVDRIVDAWRHERPDLDLAPLTVVSRVTRLARHLDLARRRAFAQGGLEMWEFEVLSALRRAGTPYRLSPGALLTQTLVTSGTMTNRIDRLEARGLVERHRAPEDRRGVLVEITPEGRERVDAAMTVLLDVERDILRSLDADERSMLASLLRSLSAQFDD